MTGSEAAAWVQAIGSVVAVLAGFGLVLFQRSQGSSDAARTLQELACALIVKLRLIRVSLSDAETTAQGFTLDCEDAIVQIRSHREVLFATNLHSLRGASVWLSIDILVGKLDRFIVALERSQRSEQDLRSRRILAVHMVQISTEALELVDQLHNAHRVRLAEETAKTARRLAKDLKDWASELDADVLPKPGA